MQAILKDPWDIETTSNVGMIYNMELKLFTVMHFEENNKCVNFVSLKD